MPNVESAAVTARVISRLLRNAGFKMADKSERHAWTEGLTVNRVGYSRNIDVDCWLPTHLTRNDDARARRREARDKARAFLKEKGYTFDSQTGWVICEGD